MTCLASTARSVLAAVVLCAFVAAGLDVGSVYPQAEAASWTGCPCDGSEDPQLVGNLLEQLSTSTEKFIGCRQQLLRQKHHVPIIIGNPLGDGHHSTIIWQAVSAVLAVACAVLFVQLRASRSKYTKLDQHHQQRETLWQQAISSVHATARQRLEQCEQDEQAWQQKEAAWQQQLTDWKDKEAAWQQGVQEVVELVQQREAALSDGLPGQQTPGETNPAQQAQVCGTPSTDW